jgi:hypothetical protein
MPVQRYARDSAPPATTTTGPNTALIAGLVTCSAVVLFLSLVLVIPMIRRRHQRSAPPPATVEEFLGKDSTFERSNPNDIAAILDHLSYLPQNNPSPRRRSLLLGRRLSSNRPSSIIGPPLNSNRHSGQQRPVSDYRNSSIIGDYESQYSVPADMRDPPPLDEYANEPRNSLQVPASAPPAVSTDTRPLNIRRRSAYMQMPRRRARFTRDVTSPQSDYSDSDSEEEDYRGSSLRPHTGVPVGKENRGSNVGDLIRSRFNRDSSAQRESFTLAAAPRPRNRGPPLSKSSGMASPAPGTARTPLDPLPEMPNSSIAVGFALADSPNDVVVVSPSMERSERSEQLRNVPLTPRNVGLPLSPRGSPLPRTPRTPGSPLKEVYTMSPPRTPLREVLTARTPLPRI